MQPSVDFAHRAPILHFGSSGSPLIVFNGGQGFVRKFSRERAERDAERVARLLPEGQRFDLIGHDADPPEDLTLDSIADQIAGLLDRYETPPVILDLSFGGVVATRLAARHPQRVVGLGLIASAHRFSPSGVARIQSQIDALQRGDMRCFLQNFAAVFRNPLLNVMLAGMLWLRRSSIVEALNDPAVIIRYLELVSQTDGVDLSAIRAPVLILGGSRDQFFGDGVMEELARQVARPTLAVLDRETHMAPVESVRRMQPHISAWFDALV
jgi:pimeloyl-ACP methyl ester carboxylesterase